ncbi:hypothetical protein BCR35DRAFT_305064 [Leucosporidium creatinivorum]|uniref:Uncharacterized protein n=1 Tax=Leucosporidium creatinivorum TaxID=106004 RepID=A0A1Y2F3J4_9BASI|nr:hypothetical protein BCR35DRAFT_305064 [Leucosporidium creatinivorum]
MAELLARRGPRTALQHAVLHPHPRPPTAFASPIVLLGRSSYATKARTVAARTPKASVQAPPSSPPPYNPPTVDLHKIETLPFLLRPPEALERLDAAGSAAFGFGAAVNLSWTRLLAVFGIKKEAKVKRIAVRALLLPTWRVDLATRGKVTVDKEDRNLHVTADIALAGFRLDPLNRLAFRFPHDGRFELYDPKNHSEQLLDAGHAITTLPFETGPLNLLAKIAAMPKLSALKHGFGLDSSHFDTYMFAAYPLYLPFYLGEFEMNGKRASAVVFGAASAKDGHRGTAIYRTYRPSPRWQPSQRAVDVNFYDRSNDPYLSEKSAFLKIQPQVMKHLAELNRPASPRLGDGSTSSKIGEISDPLPANEETWLSNPRVMRFSKHAEANKEYVKTETDLAEKEAIVFFTRRLPDYATASRRTQHGSKSMNRDQLLAVVEREALKARKAVALSKPKWVTQMEQEKSARAITVRSRASRGR